MADKYCDAKEKEEIIRENERESSFSDILAALAIFFDKFVFQ